MAQEQGERVPVHVSLECRMRRERLQLGPEQEHAVLPAVIERFFAHPVAGETERPVLPVPEREGEHAGGARLQRLLQPPTLDGGQQRFRIGMPPPGQGVRTLGLDLPPEVKVVVYLAIEDDDAPPRGGPHRLAAGRRRIDDGQTPVGQCDLGLTVDPDPGIVGTTMRNGVRHPACGR